ncbi:hypothetical protein D3C87_1657790 [compost metagenome]
MFRQRPEHLTLCKKRSISYNGMGQHRRRRRHIDRLLRRVLLQFPMDDGTGKSISGADPVKHGKGQLPGKLEPALMINISG